MSRFVEAYLSQRVAGYPVFSSPIQSTTLVEVASGDESAQVNWNQPKQRFRLPKAIRDHETYEDLKDHWYALDGPASLWPFRDPLDFASQRLECPQRVPPITMLDQPLGVGDGSTRRFQLRKQYPWGPRTKLRVINLPVASSVLIADNGVLVPAADYVLTREGGSVLFDTPPVAAHVLTAGFLFDVPVRFESDNVLDGVLEAMEFSGFSDLVLVERPLC